MTLNLVRPETLLEGEIYRYIEHTNNGNEAMPIYVTLLAYDNCPAMAIVASQDGRIWRCPRERLYEWIAK